MKGDFTRDTFNPVKHFSRVLMQQGRVTLDADANEQAAILLRYLRTMARDVIGPYAAPAGADGGFLLSTDANGAVAVSKGRYFVDGLLVENDTDSCTYKSQPDYPVPADDALLAALNGSVAQTFWIYLDVWERHVTAIEDGSIRETALDGPDTCTRAKVVWQIKALPLTEQNRRDLAAAEKKTTDRITALLNQKAGLQKQFEATVATDTATQVNLLKQLQPVDDELARLTRLSLLPVHETLLGQLVRLSNASLAARVDPGQKIVDACVTPPDSKYRGAENQLYRVEIHRGGKAGEATFKWSRDNGSVATAWLPGSSGNTLQVACARGFAGGNWVELSDDTSDLLGKPGPLVQLVKVEGDVLSVDAAATVPDIKGFPLNPKIRRWDQMANEEITLSDGAVPVQESPATGALWLNLEDGVQIQFSAGGEYRSGDYWLIPARVATGNVEWPQADDLNPQPLPPRGIEHHYALLGVASWTTKGLIVQSVRCEFAPLFSCVTQSSVQPNRGDVIRPTLTPSEVLFAEAAPVKVPKVKKPRVKKNPAPLTGGTPP